MEALGFVAGALTTACWLPQVARTIRTRSTADISWIYLVALTVGIAAWLVYGVGRRDPVIVVANAATLGLVSGLSGLKLTLARGGRSGKGPF
jgi:MtN3 and saliva related transmembrane protein